MERRVTNSIVSAMISLLLKIQVSTNSVFNISSNQWLLRWVSVWTGNVTLHLADAFTQSHLQKVQSTTRIINLEKQQSFYFEFVEVQSDRMRSLLIGSNWKKGCDQKKPYNAEQLIASSYNTDWLNTRFWLVNLDWSMDYVQTYQSAESSLVNLTSAVNKITFSSNRKHCEIFLEYHVYVWGAHTLWIHN